jgi:outer membrane beta-barrel protein
VGSYRFQFCSTFVLFVACVSVVGFNPQRVLANRTQSALESEVLNLESRPASQDVLETNTSVPNILDDILSDSQKYSKDDIEQIEKEIEGPKGVPLDHIFAVQKKFIQKKGTSEFLPFKTAFQPVDSFSKQFAWGFSYGYHLFENFGVEILEFQSLFNLNSGLGKAIQTSTGILTRRDEALWSLGSSLQWTPFTAKAGTKSSVVHFETFLLGGGGLVQYSSDRYGFVQWGVGVRSYLTRKTILKFEFKDAIDFTANDGNLHRIHFTMGLGFLL